MPTTASPPLATEFSSLPTDILDTQILPRLDGQSLASATCATTSLSHHHHLLWSNLCHSTWPSTADHRLQTLISTFSSPQLFFSHAFPIPTPDPTTPILAPPPPPPPPALISAVDLYYKNNLIFSKTEETETTTSWFRCSPFRLDLVDPKDVVPTEIPPPDGGDTCTALMNDMTLSWILIDPVHKTAANLSSHKPVCVQRHWLSGEVQVRFVSVLAGERGLSPVECAVVVNFGGERMQVREVSMGVEDMDGRHLNGRESLVILQGVLGGKRGSGVKRVEEARRRYGRYEEMKRERRERKLRVEGRLDNLCVVFGFSIFVGLFFILC